MQLRARGQGQGSALAVLALQGGKISCPAVMEVLSSNNLPLMGLPLHRESILYGTRFTLSCYSEI